MVIRKSWRGPFLSCSGYPKCRNAKSMNGGAEGEAEGHRLPAPAPKKELPAGRGEGPVPGMRVADEAGVGAGPVFPRLHDLGEDEVQGDEAGVAGRAEAD